MLVRAAHQISGHPQTFDDDMDTNSFLNVRAHLLQYLSSPELISSCPSRG